MRSQLIDAAEAYRQMADLQREVHGEATIATRHGLSPVSLAIYEILQEPSVGDEEERLARQDAGSYVIDVDPDMRDVALRVEEVLTGHAVIEWQTNEDVQRQMRRDVKGSLRATGLYDEAQMDEPRQPDRAGRPRAGGVAWAELGRVRFGDATIEYEVLRSQRRRKTVQITMDGGRVLVAAPNDTPRLKAGSYSPQEGAMDPAASARSACRPIKENASSAGETLPYLGRNVASDRPAC